MSSTSSAAPALPTAPRDPIRTPFSPQQTPLFSPVIPLADLVAAPAPALAPADAVLVLAPGRVLLLFRASRALLGMTRRLEEGALLEACPSATARVTKATWRSWATGCVTTACSSVAFGSGSGGGGGGGGNGREGGGGGGRGGGRGTEGTEGGS